VPRSDTGSEHIPVPQSTPGGCRAAGADPRDCGEQTTVWLSPDLCAAATGRVACEPQEGDAALLSGETALASAAQTEEGRGGSTGRAVQAH
jgi:hypothetical protein